MRKANGDSDSVARLTIRPTQAQSSIMAGEQIPSLIMQIIDELRARGVLITNRRGEWCVNVRGGTKPRNFLPATWSRPSNMDAL
jgi:hypothetical protein